MYGNPLLSAVTLQVIVQDINQNASARPYKEKHVHLTPNTMEMLLVIVGTKM